jgi:decaprenylphospho-beta-D-erythro-pentofuranosid-2-ulose 2-reductase
MRDGFGRIQSLLVLGGGSEISDAIVARLARDGLRRVVLGAREPERLAPPAADQVEVAVTRFDAMEKADHPRLIAELFATYGGFDAVLAAAGVLGAEGEEAFDHEAAMHVFETNASGMISALIPVAAEMRARGQGAIIVLSSVAAERARRSNYVYGASKSALDSYAQGLADELAQSSVQVLVVRPGFVRTRMTRGRDTPPLSTGPEEVAETVASGLRSGAHTVWSPPALRYVMAVLRHLPRPLFRRLDL